MLLTPLPCPGCAAPRRLRTRCSAAAEVDWRQRSRPVAPGSSYPAKEHCSSCGLCDTYYVAHVKEACAFLGDGMGRIPAAEARVHGRQRREDGDEAHFGVTESLLLVKAAPPVDGAQWTGVITTIALAALRSGLVEGVVCVASQPGSAMVSRPILALTEADILSARGVKPMLSPSLAVLGEVEARGLRRLMFIGVGCAVQALRAVEHHLGLEKLYVVGTNCTDNGTKLSKFLAAVSESPATVTGYEFMQDYTVHVKHSSVLYERVPYFSLPAGELKDVIAPSCYACFDYVNALTDITVGYMAAPSEDVPMTQHWQYMTVRNQRGQALVDLAGSALVTAPPLSSGDRRPFVLETVLADDRATLGAGRQPAPRLVGTLLARLLTAIGPRGMEFARYSLDYHTLRNAIYVRRTFPPAQAEAHLPPYAKAVVAAYDADGLVSRRVPMRPGDAEDANGVVVAAGVALLAGLLLLLKFRGS